MLKTIILPKRRYRPENSKAIPGLAKSATLISNENSGHVKVIRGRFSEISLRKKLEK